VGTSPSVQPILVLVGQPVAGNPTQFMMEKAFAHHEIDWRYLSLEVSPDELGDVVRGIRAMGFRGGNCADPYKQTIIPWLDRTGETARRTGVVNLLSRDHRELSGENTEGRGFVEALRRKIDPAGKRVVLLGAGRMARAIGVELVQAHAAEIVVVNRTEPRGRELAELLAGQSGTRASFVLWDREYPVPPDVHVLACAISVAAHRTEEPLPLDLDALDAAAVVADVTYNPPRRWLLREAARRGAATIPGLNILVEQAAINFRFWTGVDPDPTVMREAVEEFLEL
jgi:shikimate dehydrogenase